MKIFFTISTWLTIILGLSVVIVLGLIGTYISAIVILTTLCHIFCVWYFYIKKFNSRH